MFFNSDANAYADAKLPMRRFPNVTSLDRKSNTQKKKKKNLETGFKSNFEYFQIFDFFLLLCPSECTL